MSSSILILFLFVVPLSLLKPCKSTTILVDGVSEWKNPNVVVGDSIIFRHKNHYNLFIFQNQRAFNLCNFTQATLLTKPNSTSYIWHPSRPGYFYFTFNNGSKHCEGSDKFAVKVTVMGRPPIEAPTPESGGVLMPKDGAPTSASSPAGGISFINSNPAVPLPTGEVDTATIRPIPISSHTQEVPMMLFSAQVALLGGVVLLLQLL